MALDHARRCPERIVALFDYEETKEQGRRETLAWIESMIGEMSVGDVIWIPNPETGELMSYTKTAWRQ